MVLMNLEEPRGDKEIFGVDEEDFIDAALVTRELKENPDNNQDGDEID